VSKFIVSVRIFIKPVTNFSSRFAHGCNNFIGLLQISIFPGIPAGCHSISEIFLYALTDFP